MASDSFDAAFDAQEPEIRKVNDALDAIMAGIQGAKHSENLNPRNIGGPYRTCKEFIGKMAAVEKKIRDIKRVAIEHQINIYWTGKLQKKYDLSDYEAKRTVVSDINVYIREQGYAIRHPETGAPCTLLASSSPDGKGRYVLSDRKTKKRSHTSITLLDLLPIRLVPAPRRREGLIESREKRDTQ